MKKKLFALLLFISFLFTACSVHSEEDALNKALDKFERALGDEFVKQSETEVYDFAFEHQDGSTMVYYICQTTYYAADPDEGTGLNTAAMQAVFDWENTLLLKELTIAEHPAAYYQGETHSYLCCTPSPETTLILEYDPESISEEDAFRVIHSVFVNPNP